MGQKGFFDVERRLEAISAKGDPLETIKKIVPWEDFRTDIEAVTETKPEERKSNAGRQNQLLFEVPLSKYAMVLARPFPIEQLLGARNVGPALLRIVLRPRPVERCASVAPMSRRRARQRRPRGTRNARKMGGCRGQNRPAADELFSSMEQQG
jgi:hypothetical protein